MLDTAYAPVRERMRQGVYDAAQYFAKTQLPVPPSGTLGFAFNSLSPFVIESVTDLNTKVMQTLSDSIRDVVRAHVENGIRDGVGPREVARNIRGILGLSTKQLETVENYRRSLEGGARSAVLKDALGRELRDRRYDGTVAKAIKEGEQLPKEKIDKMVAAYTKKMVQHNAETVARTTALDAQKAAQDLSWKQAIEQGIVDKDKLYKTWIGVMDDRERPEHVAMEKETVPFDMPYSNGEMIPGESTWNCRCVSQYSQGK